MRLAQMIITRTRCLKDRQAHPTDMCSTSLTSHVIAPFRLLHGRLAPRTILNVEFLLQLLERLIATRLDVFVFRARVIAVSGVATRAERLETVRAGVCWRV